MPRVARAGQRQNCHVDIAYSDSSQGDKSQAALPITEDSYRAGPVPGLDNSQASLNKRVASVAGLDDSAPKDFDFLFDAAQAKRRGISAVAGCGAITGAAGDTSPLKTRVLAGSGADVLADSRASQTALDVFEEGDVRWVRTEITKGADLVDGQAWILEYQRRVVAAKSDTQDEACSDSKRTAADMLIRNRVLREMASVAPPGKKVKLATGQEVIFWFNVGASGPPRARVQVTDARCPHQGVCLLKGELMEIEDASGIRHAMTRCSRHNKSFNLRTGASHGNAETLKVFPCRFTHGHWYVGVDMSAEVGIARLDTPCTSDFAAVVASLEPPPVMTSTATGSSSEAVIPRKKRRAALTTSGETNALN